MCDLYRAAFRVCGSVADILLGTLTRIGKDTRRNVVHFPARTRNLSLLQNVDTGLDTDLYAVHSMATVSSLSWGKSVGA